MRRDIGVSSDNVKFRMMDLKDKRSIAKFVEVIRRKHNRLDILVNNAAVYHQPLSTRPVPPFPCTPRRWRKS